MKTRPRLKSVFVGVFCSTFWPSRVTTASGPRGPAAFTHPADGGISLEPLLPTNLFADGVGGVFALSVAAFVGYESALAYGETFGPLKLA